MLDSFEFLVFSPSFLMCCLLRSSVKEFLKCVFSLLLFKFFLEMLFFCHTDTDTDSNLLINHSFLKDFFKSHLLYVYVEKMRESMLCIQSYPVYRITDSSYSCKNKRQVMPKAKSCICLKLVMMRSFLHVFVNSLGKVTHRFFTHFFFFIDQNYA